ncbi:MAG TPA: SAM-dependent methyltransferase [Candidatus Competibacteraceae bacterium]|nr:SAM-dependent methyltransferase [Candidatus Competibacteraceae bacterium]
MKLDQVIPFGRSLDEYQNMFALSDGDLKKKIVGVGDGPASFNAELFALGKTVVSVDPLYIFSAEAIEKQFSSVVDLVIDQVKATPGDWVWSYHRSPAHLKANRVAALHAFVADYERGKAAGRYMVGELPILSFERDRFDLALCSHLLFLYSDHLSYEFHRASVREMLRVASEVRLFPLLTLRLEVSPHLHPLIKDLKTDGFAVRREQVGYELQRGGNEMLRIQRVLPVRNGR